MPDITKCDNKDCPLKDTCYRFTSKPSPVYQSYQDYDHKNGKCKYYVKVKNK